MEADVEGISCQHLQVMTTQEECMAHGSENKTTMNIAHMDIKSAFDVARPKCIAKHGGTGHP